MHRTLLLGLAAAALPALSAMAAPATPEEAARLAALFERYVGHPAPGEPAAVTVVPKGDAYVTTLDLKRALAGLNSFGIAVEAAPSATTLLPLPDGTWRVTSADGPPITVRGGGQTLTLTSATSSFDGIYDPKLYGFSHSRQEQTGYESRQTTPTSSQDRRGDRLAFDLDGTAARGGGVDVKGRYDMAGMSGDIAVGAPAPAAPPGGPAVAPPSSAPNRFAYAIPAGLVSVGIDGLRTKDVLDLWAFLVAHPGRDSLAAAQDDLKAMLRAGLPYLGALSEEGSFRTFALSTPVGPVSASSIGFSLGAGGLSNHGTADLGLSVAGLKVPPGQLPPWSAGLVPTALDLHIRLDGFNAAAAASAAVDDFDLRQPVVFNRDQQAAVAQVLWPGDGSVTMRPSRIATDVLDLRMEGRATLGPQPAGRVTITGTGLEREIAALQGQAANDPGASQVLGPLVFAKNLAKPGPDGGLLWVVEMGPAGVTVNGAPLR